MHLAVYGTQWPEIRTNTSENYRINLRLADFVKYWWVIWEKSKICTKISLVNGNGGTIQTRVYIVFYNFRTEPRLLKVLTFAHFKTMRVWTLTHTLTFKKLLFSKCLLNNTKEKVGSAVYEAKNPTYEYALYTLDECLCEVCVWLTLVGNACGVGGEGVG